MGGEGEREKREKWLKNKRVLHVKFSLTTDFALSKLFIGFIKRLRIVAFSVRNSNLLCYSF